MTTPTEVVLYRLQDDGPYRIGVEAGAEHAYGRLRPDVTVLRSQPGEWVISIPETGQEARDTEELGREHWRQFIPDYPLEALAPSLQRSVANGVQSHLVFRLVLRDVAYDEWGLESSDDALRLRDTDGNLLAEVDYPDWWYAREDRWLRTLAAELVRRSGVEEVPLPELIERHREGEES